MAAAWADQGRDEAYSHLCQAITAVGPEQDRLFLARLCLLMMEALGDADRTRRLIDEARLDEAASPLLRT